MSFGMFMGRSLGKQAAAKHRAAKHREEGIRHAGRVWRDRVGYALAFVGVASLAAVSLAACGGAPKAGMEGQTAAAAQEPASEAAEARKVRTPDDPMGLLPKACQVAIHVDGEVLRQTPQLRRLLEQTRTRITEQQGQLAEYFLEHTEAVVIGLDLVAEARRARAAVVLRGDFEQARVFEAFGGDANPSFPQDERGIRTLMEADEVVIQWLDERTLVASDPALAPAVAELAEAVPSGGFRDHPGFKDLAAKAEIGQHAISVVAAVSQELQARLAALSKRDLAFQALSGMMSTISGAVAHVDMGSGGAVYVSVFTGSPEQANALASLGRLLQGSVVHAVDDPGLKALVKKANIHSSGVELRARSQLDAEEMDALWSHWESQLAPPSS